LLGLGKAYNTLSGRTAVYRREALLNDKYDNVHELTHEFFLNARAVSGDDKRLSHLVLEQGWTVAFAQDAVVYTQGMDKMRVFLKQRLRWTRNSWRADIRAIKRGWVFKYPVLAYFMLDRFIQPFLMLLGPVAVVIGIIHQQWLFVAVLVVWWMLSRLVRLFSYFHKYPKRLVYLPSYIVYSYVNAILKIYALATILENSWATRWHKSRMRRRLFRRSSTVVVGQAAVAGVLFLLVGFVNQANSQTAVDIPQPSPVVNGEFAVPQTLTANIPAVPQLPSNAVLTSGVKSYTTVQGDTLFELATRFSMDITILKKLNGIRDPDKINAGTTILYFTIPTTATGTQP
jgi:LysM repeat protein